MLSFRLKQIPILLSILLTFTLVVNGFAVGRSKAGIRAKNLKMHQGVRRVITAPVFDCKAGARKETSSRGGDMMCAMAAGLEFGAGCFASRLDGESPAQMALSDLSAVRGRAPPRKGVS